MVIFIFLVIVILYIVIRVKKQKKGEKEAVQERFTIDSSTDAAIEEAITVINDFLEVGHTVSLVSEKYGGAISAFTKCTNAGKYKVIITMNKSGNLQQAMDKYPKMFANNPKMAEKSEAFLYKYRNCYNAAEDSYIYETRNSVALRRGQENGFRAKLLEQVRQRCSLAEVRGDIIFTSNVPRD